MITMAVTISTLIASQTASAGISEAELKSISTPNKVETSIGTLEFLDGHHSSRLRKKSTTTWTPCAAWIPS